MGRGMILNQLSRRDEFLQGALTGSAVMALGLDRSSVPSIESPAVLASPGEFR